MVDGVDDVRMRGEEGVGFCFFQSEGDGLLAEGTADLFQGVELGGRGFLDEVDVGEAALKGDVSGRRVLDAVRMR